MKPRITFTILILTLLYQVTSISQTVDYHLIDVLPKVRTEKIEPDGSIWYSYVKQDTFHLDSISPVGQIFSKINIPLQLDTQQFYSEYWMEPQRGLVITIHQQDSIYESGHIAVQLYNLTGILQWETEFTPMQDDFAYSYSPRVLNDSLFLYGYSQYEGDTSWDIGLFNLSWNGDSVNFKWVGFCGLNINYITPQSAFFMHRGGCSLSGFAAPDILEIYDSNFQIQKSINFTDSTNGTTNDPIYGKGISTIDDNTFHGYTIGEWDNKMYDCMIQINSGNQNWINIYQVFHPTVNPYLVKFNVSDIIRLDSGFLFYISEKKWDSTFTNIEEKKSLVWTTSDFQNITFIYNDTITVSSSYIEMYSIETFTENIVFVNHINYDGVYHGYNLKLTIDKSITSINKLIHTESQFTIYPNPATNTLFINNTELGVLELYDLTGRLVFTTHLQNQNTQINVATFKNGMYILKFTNDAGIFQTERLIIRE